MPLGGTLLDITNLSAYADTLDGAIPLVEEFDLRVQPGKIVGLVGETGAGKSLSMRAAIGLLPNGIRASAGTVAFGGQEISASDPAQLRRRLGHGIALLMQHTRSALNPFLRASAQIERVARYQGVPRNASKNIARELLSSVDLAPDEILPRYPHQLSGGQAQRVALAITLASNPRLLIADEPTTALDVSTQATVINLLQRVCRERDMGLILITHNLALISRVVDDVVLMRAGRVVERGTAQRIFTHPEHAYTVSLMAAILDPDGPGELLEVR
jgi:ABC-type glutathione transport system ATPase component